MARLLPLAGVAATVAARHHGAATAAELAAAGVGYRQVRQLVEAGVLVDAAPGVVRATSTTPTPHQRLWVATHAGGGHAVAAFEAAAWLHRMDGFDRPPLPEVLLPPGKRLRCSNDVIVHWGNLDGRDLVEVDGIPCTGLARTACDLAGKLGSDAGLRALDDLDRRGVSLRWVALTAERLRRPGDSGARRIATLLTQRTGQATESWFERLVERCLRTPGLPPWTRQHVVRDESGAFVARIDLACPMLRLGVEAHSKRFHFGIGPETDDQRRDDDLAALGWDLRYVGWHAATRTPDDVAATIMRVAHRRAHDLAVGITPTATATNATGGTSGRHRASVTPR